MSHLTGKRVAFLLTDGFEDSELTSPWQAVTEAGATATLVAPADFTVKGKNGHEQSVDTLRLGCEPDDFDALVLPGGVVNADHLRMDQDAVAFARALLRAAQAGRRHLPRRVDPHRGRRRATVARSRATPASRPTFATPVRTGSTRGRRGRRPRFEPHAGRPPRLQRQGGRGDRRGRTRRQTACSTTPLNAGSEQCRRRSGRSGSTPRSCSRTRTRGSVSPHTGQASPARPWTRIAATLAALSSWIGMPRPRRDRARDDADRLGVDAIERRPHRAPPRARPARPSRRAGSRRSRRCRCPRVIPAPAGSP